MKQNLPGKFLGNKLCLLVLLAWMGLSTTSCTIYYYSPDGGTFSGVTSYATGATATANTFTYTQCSASATSFGGSSAGVSGTAQWYYNTTGSTLPASSTAYGASFPFTSPSSGSSGTISYTPSTATGGIFYYFAYMTWTGSDYCSVGYITPAQAVTVTATSIITGPDSLCTGDTVTLTDTTTGGSWSSTNTSLATISPGGVVTGISAGRDTIRYSGPGFNAYYAITIHAIPIASVTDPATICSGGSTTVSFSGTPGATVYYNIDAGSTLSAVLGADSSTSVSTGVLYGNATYNLVSATSGGCSATIGTSAVITVSAPTHTITGDSTVCTGLTTTLSDAPTGGTWESSSTTYATVNAVSGVVTGIASGAETISYLAPTTGCLSLTTLTVNPSPSPISAITLCQGNALSAVGTESVTGGTWSIGPSSIATINSTTGAVYGVSGGTATDTYTLPAGCFVTATVTVNALPAPITGADSVCAGLTTTLGDTSTTGGISGTWSSSDAAIASVTTPGSAGGAASDAVAGVSAGMAAITYTLHTGCYITTEVTVNPSPAAITAPTTTVCAGSTLDLSVAPTTGGYWSTASSFAAVDTAGVVTGGSAGVAAISYTLPAGACVSVYDVTVNPLPAAITGADSVCAGLTTLLSDASTTAGTAGSWTSSNAAVASVTATGPAGADPIAGVYPGTDTITYTLPTGCLITQQVTVNPTPAAITGGTAVCQGLTLTLSEDSSGGAWSALPAATASIDAVSGVLTGLAAGTAIVTYTLPPGGCTATAAVTVNPLPAPITGADSVCAGLTTDLTGDAAPGTWTSTDASAATVDGAGVVTGIAAGNTEIYYTFPTGCLDSFGVTVNPLPGPVMGADAVCSGSSVSFTDDTAGGAWSVAPASVATINAASGVLTGVLTGSSAAPATVTYTIPTGCIATGAITVNPLPGPIAGPDSVCLNATAALSEGTAGGAWTSSDTAIAAVDGSGNVFGVAVGTAAITYMLPTGCLETIPMTVNPLPLPITGPAAVCVNASINMSDLSAPGAWSAVPGSVAAINSVTGSLTGVAPGLVTVIYTLPTGCATDTSVTVNAIPDSIGGALAVCADSGTTTLTEAVRPGTWSITPASLAIIDSLTGVVTGISAGPATVTYTLPVTGCYIAEDFTVNPLPLPVTGTATVCAASSVVLRDATPSGTWSAAPPSVATVNAVTGAVRGIGAGTADITYTLPTGCLVTYTVTVDPQPAAIITPLGDTMICPGGFVDLTANTGDSLSYQWGDPGAISGATASSFIAAAAGSYKVRVTNGFGCSLSSLPVAVSVNPVTIPVITAAGGAAATCAGTPLLLSTTPAAGLTYQWQQDSVAIPGATSNAYGVAASAGNYQVVVTNATGCSAPSNAISVAVLPAPLAYFLASGPLTFCSGGSVLLTANDNDSFSYQWYNAAGPVGGATGLTYSAAASGAYWVEETSLYNGCTASSADTVTLNVLPLPGATITPAGSTTFCSGSSVVLNGPSGPGDAYQWYEAGMPIPGATSSSYTDTLSGSFTLLVTAPTGCTDSSAAPLTVVVVTTPAVLPLTPTSFCWGGSATLSVDVLSSAGALTYQWFYDGDPVAGATNAVYNTSAPGTYRCLITTGACTTPTTDITVTEHPLPDPLITFDGAQLLTQDYYTAYHWYRNTVAVAGATDSALTPEGDASYAVAVTDSNGCQAVSDIFILTDLAVSKLNNSAIRVFPNPARALIHIAAPMRLRAEILGMDGRALITRDNARDIDISPLANGPYMILLYDTNGVLLKSEKLTKVGE